MLFVAGAETKVAEEKQYLPEQGEWAVGVDLIPIVKTIGGAFTGDNEAPAVGGTPMQYDQMWERPNVSIMGKYMLTDHVSLKANLGLSLKYLNHKELVDDDLNLFLNPDSKATVEDAQKTTRFGGSLMFGAEYRVGRKRVQGIFGGGIMAGFSMSKTSYSYGNAITSFNQIPSTGFYDCVENGYRITSYDNKTPNFMVGVYGSAGVEWFVAPKVALGAEVDLYAYGVFSGKGVKKSEGFNEAYGYVENRTDIVKGADKAVNFGTDNLGGSLYIMFYF